MYVTLHGFPSSLENGSGTGLAGAQDYLATYISFYKGTKNRRFLQGMKTISEMGDNLVADRRTKDGMI
jgi:hypothetical protein